MPWQGRPQLSSRSIRVRDGVVLVLISFLAVSFSPHPHSFDTSLLLPHTLPPPPAPTCFAPWLPPALLAGSLSPSLFPPSPPASLLAATESECSSFSYVPSACPPNASFHLLPSPAPSSLPFFVADVVAYSYPCTKAVVGGPDQELCKYNTLLAKYGKDTTVLIPFESTCVKQPGTSDYFCGESSALALFTRSC